MGDNKQPNNASQKNDTKENVEKLANQMKNLEKTRNLFKIISVAVFGLPVVTLILIFTMVSNGIITINGAFSIARAVLIVMAVGNLALSALYFFSRNDKSKRKGIVLLPLSFIYIFVVIYITFMLPVKFVDYSKYDTLKIGGMDIPTIHRYTGHEGILVSFKTSKDTEIGKDNKVNCNIEFIYIFYNDRNTISNEEAEKYAAEMEKEGFTKKVTTDSDGKTHTICYIYNESENYILYSLCDGYSMIYSKVTSNNKLPSEGELLESI